MIGKDLAGLKAEVLELLDVAVEIASTDWVLRYVNPAWVRLTGFTAEEAVGRTPKELLRGDDHDEPFWRSIDDRIDIGLPWSGRVDSRAKDGSLRPCHLRITPVPSADGSAHEFLVVRRDLRPEIEASARLRDEALHDPLTELPNRRLFFDRLDQALRRAERRCDHHVAVLLLTLDGFRGVAEAHGRAAAEQALQVLAPRLRSVLRPEDTLARLDGGEFAVVLTEASPEHADAVGERLLGRLSEPLEIAGGRRRILGSVGVAMLDADTTGEELVARADRALTRARRLGPNRVEQAAGSGSRRTSRTELAAALRRGLARGELIAKFEPIVDLVSERVVGFETLARWPGGPPEMDRPDAFVPLAEETGQLFALADVMLEHAGALAKSIEEHVDYFPVGVTLNISAGQLVAEDLVSRIDAFLARWKVDPAFLQLEITERSAMRNPEHAIATCTSVRKLGVRIAIDDFGTGHSSLSHLQRLPVSTIKIDKSFVRDLDRRNGNREIVRAIMALTRALGLEVIAEGIERRGEHNALLALGCKRGQGFLYSRALDGDEALAAALRGSGSQLITSVMSPAVEED